MCGGVSIKSQKTSLSHTTIPPPPQISQIPVSAFNLLKSPTPHHLLFLIVHVFARAGLCGCPPGIPYVDSLHSTMNHKIIAAQPNGYLYMDEPPVVDVEPLYIPNSRYAEFRGVDKYIQCFSTDCAVQLPREFRRTYAL